MSPSTCNTVTLRLLRTKPQGKSFLKLKYVANKVVGYCKDMPSTVRPYERLCDRPKPTKAESRRERQRSRCEGKEEALPTADPPEFPEAMDHVFPGKHVKLFNGIYPPRKANGSQASCVGRP